jgi:TPR repeat protein
MSQFKALAAEGDAVAMYYLGILYDRGYGVPGRPRRGRQVVREGAARGDSLSAYHIGKMTEAGRA